MGHAARCPSFRSLPVRREVSSTNSRSDASITYPVVEYGHLDALLQGNSAVTMGPVYRGSAIRQLSNLVLFGDNPSGEIFYINADNRQERSNFVGEQRRQHLCIGTLFNYAGQCRTIHRARLCRAGQTVAMLFRRLIARL